MPPAVRWAEVAAQLPSLGTAPSAAGALHDYLRGRLADDAAAAEDAAPDDLAPVFAALGREAVRQQRDALWVPLLRALRLLARKPANREGLLPQQADALVALLQEAAPHGGQVCSEACLCVRNFCLGAAERTERGSDAALLLTGAAPSLAKCLRGPPALAACAAGAVQALCLVSSGQRAAAECGCVTGLLLLLEDDDAGVLLAAAGALHNAVAHRAACREVLAHCGVGAVAALLRHPSSDVQRYAAGAVQSLTRDAGCLEVLRELRAAEALAAHISQTPDPKVQLAAMGALLNILGPSRDDPGRRQALKDAMADVVAAAALRDALACPPTGAATFG
eukprot:TRINITY_DN2842_c0_g2_i2.p1 TRINITY_DN2842_c0_g2~~TRINITY_DN2842_c0_g2_i2.p1  ORF type:complete len:362 (+),score=129.68 TRINITY_DN2842_c0_g2_i2:79-1086(+)